MGEYEKEYVQRRSCYPRGACRHFRIPLLQWYRSGYFGHRAVGPGGRFSADLGREFLSTVFAGGHIDLSDQEVDYHTYLVIWHAR